MYLAFTLHLPFLPCMCLPSNLHLFVFTLHVPCFYLAVSQAVGGALRNGWQLVDKLLAACCKVPTSRQRLLQKVTNTSATLQSALPGSCRIVVNFDTVAKRSPESCTLLGNVLWDHASTSEKLATCWQQFQFLKVF